MQCAASFFVPAEIRIGTSGYSYKHWRGRYYPEDLPASEWLRFYLRDFDTVELNNTFYHLPTEQAFDNWRKSTPHGFLFAVKGSRFLTHMIKLKDPARGFASRLRCRPVGVPGEPPSLRRGLPGCSSLLLNGEAQLSEHPDGA